MTSVPRRFAELVRSRAYRTRSVEISRVKSQRTGRTYETVVSAVAWLGGKMPAVRTLADVTRLYDGGFTVTRVLEFGDPEADAEYRLEASRRLNIDPEVLI